MILKWEEELTWAWCKSNTGWQSQWCCPAELESEQQHDEYDDDDDDDDHDGDSVNNDKANGVARWSLNLNTS